MSESPSSSVPAPVAQCDCKPKPVVAKPAPKPVVAKCNCPVPQAAVPAVAAPAPDFNVVFRVVDWNEAVRPAIQGNRVVGPVLGAAFNEGRVRRHEREVDLLVVKSDGQKLPLRTTLGQRGELAVNEAAIALSRAEAASFGISNIVPKGGSFLPVRDGFYQEEIRSSAARGSRGIIFFLIAGPPMGSAPAPRM